MCLFKWLRRKITVLYRKNKLELEYPTWTWRPSLVWVVCTASSSNWPTADILLMFTGTNGDCRCGNSSCSREAWAQVMPGGTRQKVWDSAFLIWAQDSYIQLSTERFHLHVIDISNNRSNREIFILTAHFICNLPSFLVAKAISLEVILKYSNNHNPQILSLPSHIQSIS